MTSSVSFYQPCYLRFPTGSVDLRYVYLAIQVDRRFAFQLMAGQVRVVRRCYVITRQWIVHVRFFDHRVGLVVNAILFVHHVLGESFEGHTVSCTDFWVQLVRLSIDIRISLIYFECSKEMSDFRDDSCNRCTRTTRFSFNFFKLKHSKSHDSL